MQANLFDIYDIDGTLTLPGHDLWYLSTRSLSADKDLFDRYVAEWKNEIHTGIAPFDCSLTMMRRGLSLLKNAAGSETITDEVQRITDDLIDTGFVCRKAIDFLKGRIRGGNGAVLSTTNYREGAVGFLLALKKKGWIGQTELQEVFISGSRIDWNTRTVIHFNMGRNKVFGLVDALGIGAEAIRNKIGCVFGDDPLGNDRELLEIASHPFVIKNENNRCLNLPDRIRLVTWSEIEALSVSELTGLRTGPAHK